MPCEFTKVLAEKKTMKSYSELCKLKTFDERFEYLKIGDKKVGEDTFGSHRYLNQKFYKSPIWEKTKSQIISRDLGRNMGLEGEEFGEMEKVIVHHINPITEDDIIEGRACVLDPENLISVGFATHNAIHYGKKETLNRLIERKPGDTKIW